MLPIICNFYRYHLYFYRYIGGSNLLVDMDRRSKSTGVQINWAAVRCNFTFEACHIPGVVNPIAGALSLFNWLVFRQLELPIATRYQPSFQQPYCINC
jgi:hypothetical protein